MIIQVSLYYKPSPPPLLLHESPSIKELTGIADSVGEGSEPIYAHLRSAKIPISSVCSKKKEYNNAHFLLSNMTIF